VIDIAEIVRRDGDSLMIDFGRNMPVLYCDSVSMQTQSLRFMRSEASVKNLKPLPAHLDQYGLSIYGTIQKIERRIPTAKHRAELVKEFQDLFGMTLNERWVIVIRNGVVRLTNGKGELKEDCYGVSLRFSKGFRPFAEPELVFDDRHHLLIPMTEVMEMLQARLGLLVDPLAWQKQSNFGKKVTEVLVVNRRK